MLSGGPASASDSSGVREHGQGHSNFGSSARRYTQPTNGPGPFRVCATSQEPTVSTLEKPGSMLTWIVRPNCQQPPVRLHNLTCAKVSLFASERTLRRRQTNAKRGSECPFESIAVRHLSRRLTHKSEATPQVTHIASPQPCDTHSLQTEPLPFRVCGR